MHSKVLVVDDEEPSRTVLVEMLPFIFPAATITPCDCSSKAIKALKKNPKFDWLITDWNMVRGDGPEVIRAAQQLKAAKNILVISGVASNRRSAEKLGVKFLSKPYLFAELQLALA